MLSENLIDGRWQVAFKAKLASRKVPRGIRAALASVVSGGARLDTVQALMLAQREMACHNDDAQLDDILLDLQLELAHLTGVSTVAPLEIQRGRRKR